MPIVRFPPARYTLVLLMAAIMAACGVIGPDKEQVEKFAVDIMPAIAEWRPETLKPYATEEFNKKMRTPEQARMYVMFSRLGDLDSFQPPKTVGYFTSTEEGTRVTVEIAAKFSKGPALVKMTLRSRDGDLKLYGLNIQSPVFDNPSSQPQAPQQI
jgi:hypothetical protein